MPSKFSVRSIVGSGLGLAVVALDIWLQNPAHVSAHLKSMGYSGVHLKERHSCRCGRMSYQCSFEALSPSGRLVSGFACGGLPFGYIITEIHRQGK